MQPVSLSVARRDLRTALSGPAGQNTILSLSVGGSTYNAIVKEMQRHPVRRNVSHVDFIQIDLAAEIVVSIPLHLTGTAKAVVGAGGLVDPAVDSIEVRATPANLPNEILIDITDMQPDQVIRLSEVPLPAGVVATGDPDMPVVTVLISRAGVETAATAAEEAPAEGAAAPAPEASE
jgi:large subunit ribosomal protein L25